MAPLLFLIVGVVVLAYNATHDASVILLPFLGRLFPVLQHDLPSQGRLTGILFLVVGLVYVTWTAWIHRREQRLLDSEPDGPPS